MEAALSPNWKKRAGLFIASQSVTLFGSTLVQMAIVWYVAVSTSSGAWVSAFTICAYIPQFLISFFSGVWADRYNKKLLIIVSDAAIAAATLILFFVLPLVMALVILLDKKFRAMPAPEVIGENVGEQQEITEK